MLSEYEDRNIIAAFLTHLQCLWRRNEGWQPRYFVTDDWVVEQQAMRLVFEDST